MTLANVFKAAGLVAAGFGIAVAAEKVSAAKKEKSEEVADEVTTEDFKSEVAEDSEEE